MRKFLLVAACFTSVAVFSQPAITNYSPLDGPVGTIVTITGTNFDPTPSNNVVKFNGVSAVVSASTAISITTTVPVGATTGLIAVTVGGNTATSAPGNFTVQIYSPLGNAMNCDGIQDYAVVPDNAALRPSTLTLEAWVNFSYAPGSIFAPIINKVLGTAINDSYQLFYLNGFLKGTVMDAAGQNTIVQVAFSPNPNQWYHTAFTFDNATKAQKLYLDGVLVGSNTAVAAPDYDNGSVYLGSDFDNAVTYYSFPGILDEIRIWNVARSQAEIQSTMTSMLAGSETGLTAYYKMDETGGGAGITIANSATVTGAALDGVTVGTSCSPIFTFPWITGFSPTSAPIGTVVTITGSGFNSNPANVFLEFDGTDAVVLTSSPTTITAIVPAGATTGLITAGTSCYTNDSNSDFTVVPYVCPPTTLTGGDLDASFNPNLPDPDAFPVIKFQSSGKIIASTQEGIQRFNADGTPDGSFNGASNYNSGRQQLIVQPDDKIIVMRNSDNSINRIDRLNSDGTPDPTFNGPSFDNFDTSEPDAFGPIGLQSDGKIIYSSGVFTHDLYRMNSDGTPDASFHPPSHRHAYVIKQQSDGQILVGGSFSGGIMRLDLSGNEDAAFSSLGLVNGTVYDIAFQPDNKIVVAGNFNSVDDVACNGIARLNPDGTLDQTFNAGNGVSGTVLAVRVLADGRILIAGGFATVNDVARNQLAVLKADGSLDCSFDPLAGPDLTVQDVEVQADQKILVAGSFMSYQGVSRYALARVNNNAPLPCVPPAAPAGTGASNCGPGTISLTATGGASGQYRWYTLATGGSPITGQSNATFTTPNISSTTTYYVSISNGTCESARTSIAATINPLPASPVTTAAKACSNNAVTLSASGGTAGQYRWYSAALGGTAIAGQTGPTFTTPVLTVTTTYFVSINDGTCEGQRSSVVATISNCSGPTIPAKVLSTEIGGEIIFDLASSIVSPSAALNLSSIQIITPPPSGAKASLSSSDVLTVDYSGINFAGEENIVVRACDQNGNCTTQTITLDVVGDIVIYNAVSPAGDNPTFVIGNIDVISSTKTNTVTIFDRWQNQVWRGSNYDNQAVVFRGVSDGGGDLPTGTYYYKIEFTDGRPAKTGFISLKR